MREALVKVKQPTPELDKKGVVYEVPCRECNHVYIGDREEPCGSDSLNTEWH